MHRSGNNIHRSLQAAFLGRKGVKEVIPREIVKRETVAEVLVKATELPRWLLIQWSTPEICAPTT